MPFRFVVPFVSGLFLATGAMASTVVLDFQGGTNTGMFGVASTAWPVNSVGTWSEDGFDVGWQGGFYDYGPVPSDFTGFRTLATDPAGPQENGWDMTLSRADGGTFSLSGIDTSWTYEGEYAYGYFTPEAGSSLAPLSFGAPALNPSLMLTGVTSSGQVVTGLAYTTDAASWQQDNLSLFEPHFFGPTSATFSSGTLASMTDLVSLRLSVDYGSSPQYQALGALGRVSAFVNLGAPDLLLTGLGMCGFTTNCVVPGLGTFNFGSNYGGWNDSKVVSISAITLQATPPAPVPLPASALLLLGALGLLAGGRALRRV